MCDRVFNWWRQEINTGEAGVSEWITALQNSFKDWMVYYSDQILQQKVIFESNEQIAWLKAFGQHESNLHLAVSVRSFRSERVSNLVQAILDNQPDIAKQIYQEIKQDYPIVLCRGLKQSKRLAKRKSQRFRALRHRSKFRWASFKGRRFGC